MATEAESIPGAEQAPEDSKVAASDVEPMRLHVGALALRSTGGRPR